MDEPNTPPADEWYGPRPANYPPPIFAAVAAKLGTPAPVAIDQAVPAESPAVDPDSLPTREISPVQWSDHHGELRHVGDL